MREAGPYLAELVCGAARKAELRDNFDTRFGTNTTSSAMPWDLPSLACAGAEVYHYETLPSSAIQSAIETVPANFSEYVFIDLGCGKGRALLVAAQFAFVRVVGIELSCELAAIVNINIDRYRAVEPGGADIEVHVCDVLAYEFPPQPLVLFLFNPFGAATLRRVCSNLAQSLHRNPRRAYLIYVNPLHQRVIAGFPEWRELRSPSGLVVYESVLGPPA